MLLSPLLLLLVSLSFLVTLRWAHWCSVAMAKSPPLPRLLFLAMWVQLPLYFGRRAGVGRLEE